MDDSGIDSDQKYQLLFENQVLLANDSAGANISTFNSALKSSKTLPFCKSDKFCDEVFEVKKTASLIPIDLLPIPASKTHVLEQIENKPLVDWESDDRGSEEEVEFFPVSRNRPQLTDTFSIEEFNLSPDDEDLDLLPPEETREVEKLAELQLSYNVRERRRITKFARDVD
ncbi:uncharacterized protein [Bemisia tabaci]|uniref:uncharacterized protein isoform X2 n=1 Tax=Bemisia tabaci TaxID=7038 RepID=UPI003B2891D9